MTYRKYNPSKSKINAYLKFLDIHKKNLENPAIPDHLKRESIEQFADNIEAIKQGILSKDSK